MSSRNTPLLVFRQHVFCINRKRKDITYWRCSDKSCPASAKQQRGWITSFGEHTHKSNELGIRYRSIRTKVKNLALNTEATGKEILQSVAAELDDDSKLLIDEKNLLKFINRARIFQKRLITKKPIREAPLDGGVNYKIVPSQRGSDLLVYDGYIFHKNRQYKETTRWVCTKFRGGCKAACHLSNGGWLTIFKSSHNHDKPSDEEIQMKNYKQEIRNRAINSKDSPSEIIKNVIPEDQYKRQKILYTRCIQKLRQRYRRNLTAVKNRSSTT